MDVPTTRLPPAIEKGYPVTLDPPVVQTRLYEKAQYVGLGLNAKIALELAVVLEIVYESESDEDGVCNVAV